MSSGTNLETQRLADALKEFSDANTLVSSELSPSLTELVADVRRAFPDRKIQAGVRGFSIFGCGSSGFPVAVETVGESFIVYVGPGIVEIACLECTRALILKACSSASHLMVSKRGQKPQSWQLVDTASNQILASGGFALLFPFLHRRSTVRMQNGML